MVPDFAADPVMTRWASDLGTLLLRAGRSTAPYNYRLDLEGSAFAGTVQVAAAYPELRFKPRRD